MPRQSHGARGVDEFQPANAPKGSLRFILKISKESISVAFSTTARRTVVVHSSRVATERKLAVGMDGGNEEWGFGTGDWCFFSRKTEHYLMILYKNWFVGSHANNSVYKLPNFMDYEVLQC